jgi:C-terminal processing protease CtpA/Prc
MVLLFACRKDDAPPPVPTGPVTLQETNNWILDSMRYYYLWNEGLPGRADTLLTGINFFNSLRKTTDSFSQMIDANNVSGTIQKDLLHAYGFSYAVVSIDGISQPLGLIKFVIPGSDSNLDGLNRGDYFTRINGKLLTASNAVQLENELMKETNGTITKAAVNGSSVTEQDEILIKNKLLLENPLYVKKTWNVGTRKVGYIFYNYFEDYFDDDLVTAFTRFKNDHVNELIIDLRYNPGGSLTAAAVLSALTAPNITEKSVFVKYSGNNKMGNQSASFESLLSVPSSGKYVSFANLSAGRLSLKRVYIITTSLTTSSSEAVINNLKPYMQVVTIGERTYGKDKASVIITDMRTPQRISWMLYPITFLLSNAAGQGNYANGIAPDYQVNELNSLPLEPLGDSTDPFIAKALQLIDDGGRVRNAIPETTPLSRSYYDSRKKTSDGSVMILPH